MISSNLMKIIEGVINVLQVYAVHVIDYLDLQDQKQWLSLMLLVYHIVILQDGAKK